MPVTTKANRKLLTCAALLAVVPAALCIPDPRPAPDAATPRMDRPIGGIMLTEVNAEGVRVVVD